MKKRIDKLEQAAKKLEEKCGDGTRETSGRDTYDSLFAETVGKFAFEMEMAVKMPEWLEEMENENLSEALRTAARIRLFAALLTIDPGHCPKGSAYDHVRDTIGEIHLSGLRHEKRFERILEYLFSVFDTRSTEAGDSESDNAGKLLG